MKLATMNISKLFASVSLAAAGVLACSAALAASGDASQLPGETAQGSVSYISGGVGTDEANAMKRAAADGRYPLALEFSQHAQPKAEFVADVKLTIEDKAGNTVLQTSGVGPYVLANVPNGQYIVKAEEDGKTQIRHVTVSAGKPEHLSLVW